MNVDFQVAGFADAASVHVPIRMLTVGRWLRPALSVVTGLTHALRVVLLLLVGTVSDLFYHFPYRFLVLIHCALTLAFVSDDNFLFLQNAFLA